MPWRKDDYLTFLVVAIALLVGALLAYYLLFRGIPSELVKFRF